MGAEHAGALLISVQNELSFVRKPGVSIPAALEAFRKIGFTG